MTAPVQRRTLLRLAGAAGLGAALSACSTRSPGPEPTTSAAPSPALTSGSATTATAPASAGFDRLARQLRGRLVRPGQSGYHPDRLLYNPRFDAQPHPAAIAQVRDSDDVAACVQFAADGGAPLRIRNGGHSYGGWSAGPGLVVDLAALATVRVDPASATARVGAGALLADVYGALARAGFSIGGGSCATVGVSGLTLGGGVGVLARSYGLTCDQVRSMTVVTADGSIRTADANRDPDLFWALRGGGGSFGAVTELTFRVRPAPRVQTFFLQWSWSAAGAVLAAWQDWTATAPPELWSTCKLLVDAGSRGRVLVAGTWVGSGSPGSRLRALLKGLPPPTQNVVGGGGYGDVMLAEAGCSGESADACISQALTPAKRQPFAASSSILQRALPEAGIDAIVAAAGEGMNVSGMVEGGASFDAFGGAIAEVDPGATAFPWRSALADVQYTATWPSDRASEDPTRFDDFVRSQRRALQPWLGDSAYVNYADRTLTDYARAYWGDNLPRLTSVKQRYDPQDVFSFPQSVPL